MKKWIKPKGKSAVCVEEDIKIIEKKLKPKKKKVAEEE